MLNKNYLERPEDIAPHQAGGTDLSDEKLWESLSQGNEIAFDEIYCRYFEKLYVYCRHLTPDTGLIKDCIQELFVELWNNRQKLSAVKYIRSYLYKSIRRKVLKQLKDAKAVQGTDIFHDSMHVTYSRERSLISEQTAQRQRDLLTRAFENLSGRQKEAIVLKFYDDLSYHEIASVMSLQKVKSARTLLYRAIDVLRAGLRNKVIYSVPATGIFNFFELVKDFWVVGLVALLF